MQIYTIEKIGSIYQENTESPFRDSLTGLFNHGFFLAYVEQELQRFKRYGKAFSLAVVDVDSFGLFNHRYGAIKGDRTLKEIAAIIKENTRCSDIVSRYNGDQFAVLYTCTDAEGAQKAAEKVRATIEAESDGQVTVSIGLSTSTITMTKGPEKLFEETKSALKQAKVMGKNKVCSFRPDSSPSCCDHRPCVLIVDDEPLNLKLMEGLLKPLDYAIHTAGNGQDALYILEKVEIDIILLDIMMPGLDGFEVCRTIKANEENRMIPVVLLTALDDMDTKVRGIEAGADDFITKPPNKTELLARIKSLIRIRRLNKSLTSMENVLFSMAKTVEAKDSYTQGHVDRVSALAISIGKKLELTNHELEALRLGGVLHDIGKLGVPGKILNKPGPLDDDEWEVMMAHPEIGYKICLPLKKNIGQALDIVRHHHEKLDGSGYPDGLKENEISMVTRVMAVADIYDALASDRPYRKAMPKEKAINILIEEAREGKIDRLVTQCLIELVSGEEITIDAPEEVSATFC